MQEATPLRKRGPTTEKHKQWRTCFVDLGPKEEKRFKCVACDLQAKAQVVIQRHFLIHTEEKPFACHFQGCNFRSRYQGALRYHRMTHEENSTYFYCDYPGCGYKARYKCFIRQHQKWHEPDKPYACDFSGCTFRGKFQYSVRNHSVVHDPRREKTFQCSFCDIKFYREIDLKIHLARHTMEQPYKCPTCPYSAMYPSILQRHICYNSRPTTREPRKYPPKGFATGKLHQCTQCEFSSNYLAKVKKHEGIVHGSKSPFVLPQLPKRFSCNFCNNFSSKYFYALEKHIKAQHQGEKPFKCPMRWCRYRSKGKSSMEAHRRKLHKLTDERAAKSKKAAAARRTGNSGAVAVATTPNQKMPECYVVLERIVMVKS